MTWSIEVRHNGLNKYRLIRGQTKEVVEQKAEAQLATWNEIEQWQQQKVAIEQENASRAAEFRNLLEKWEAGKASFNETIINFNNSIDTMKSNYFDGEIDSFADYIDNVLGNVELSDRIPGEWQVSYEGETKTAAIEFILPNIDDIPTLKEANDTAKAVDAAVFNGWVDYIDRGTGKPTRAYPKACFKSLRGVASTKLHSMAAVAPVLQLNKSDSRFIANVDVASTLEARVNLATISWQDFEYLIREIFEKELSPLGGEVRVTQASRDGGVDAIAFDPDPIWGGKIVIQAKRYTNTVGVAAVRDLFGTVHNEGANKGILVTTSNYGPD
eukprot:gene17136-17327_t